MANIKNRKKLQLIQTIWDVMLYSQHFTFHWKILVLVSRIEKSGTGDNNFGKWKGTFRSDLPKWPDQSQWTDLQSWSRTFRSDQTEMVRSIWWTNGNFRNLGLNGKRPRTPSGDQSLLLSSSWSRGRKGGSALIASNLWGRRSPLYFTALHVQYIDNLET